MTKTVSTDLISLNAAVELPLMRKFGIGRALLKSYVDKKLIRVVDMTPPNQPRKFYKTTEIWLMEALEKMGILNEDTKKLLSQ